MTNTSKMVAAAALLVTGMIHLLPIAGVFGPTPLERLYGIAIGEHNLEILMRHRAVLLALIGGLLIAAAGLKSLRGAALVTGAISAASFVAIAAVVGGTNAHLQRVVLADYAALASLTIAAVAVYLE